MSEAIIQTRGLRKEFSGRGGSRVAVDDLDLTVRQGEVHGFLGPNGSGKTTTIRMLLGLASATRGEMALFGQPVPQALPEVMRRVGAVVESPKFSPNFTGRQNLLLLARSVGVSDARVDQAVATVGLTGRDRERFKTYSLGMKQRLAIAATLLKDPALLILDEPTNGLDPSGIREVREVIRDLGAAGVTVLLSSHILAEVQQVCTAATILGNGRMLASGSVAELIGSVTTQRVVAPDPAAAEAALGAAGLRVTGRDGPALLVETAHPEEVTRVLAQAGVWLTELSPVRRGPGVDLPRGDPGRTAGRQAALARGRGAGMTGLVRVELTRLLWRRAVIALLALAIVIPVGVGILRVLDTRTQTIDDLVAANGSYVLDEIDNCLKRPGQYGVGGADDLQAACEEKIAGWYGNSPLSLVDEREQGGAIAAIVLVALMMLLAGTTFVGHDWNTGSMSNQLLFEPRRTRVWTAKAIAVALLTGAVSPWSWSRTGRRCG